MGEVVKFPETEKERIESKIQIEISKHDLDILMNAYYKLGKIEGNTYWKGYRVGLAIGWTGMMLPYLWRFIALLW